MDFSVSDDERAVADLARQILLDHTSNEQQKALEASGAPYDEGLWRALADADLLRTALPEESGGAGLGFLALGLLLQEVGRAVARVPAYPALVLGALPIAKFGSAAQNEWLSPTCDPLVTAALSEYASSDPLAPATRAAPDGGGFRLTGSKAAVPYAEQAGRILVPAREESGRIGLFFLRPGDAGVTLSPQAMADGQPHAQLELNGARVSDDDRLGSPDRGIDVLRWIVEHAIAARCMMQLGVVERALEMTAAYARDRVQFERPIGSFQAVHQRAADAYINVEAQRLTALEAVWRLAQDRPASEHVAIAKFWAAEGGQSASVACQHLHGGIGIDLDYPLHRHFVWAIHLEHELGSAKHHLEHLGRGIAEGGLPD